MPARRHDLDALRIHAFALLIVYHVAMAYVADWAFHLKGSWTFDWLQWPMIALNRWRMPLLFAVSGIALGLALPAQGRLAFVLRRSRHLLLPLAFGIVAVVSLQAYCEAVDKGDVVPGLGAFLLRYWQFRPWPEASFTGAAHGFTWNHLWYLPYLLAYTLLLVAAASALRPLRGLLPGWRPGERTLAAAGLLLPAAWLAAANLWLLPCYPATHALVDDVFVHAQSLPVFALGFAAARWQRGWELLRRGRGLTLGLALVALALELGLRALGRTSLPAEVPAWLLALPWAQGERIARAAYTWTALLAIFGWAQVWLDRPFAWLGYARQAVFCWYITHQTVLIVLLYWLRPFQLGPWLEPALVLAGTVAGCAAFHHWVVLSQRWLHPLFGVQRGRPHPAPAACQASATPAAAD